MKIIKKPDMQREPMKLGHLLFRIIPYWPLLTLLFVTAILGSWLYLKSTTPLYQVTARMLFQDEKQQQNDAKSLQSLDVLSPKRTVDNEMEVLQSREIVTAVVDSLALYAPIYEKGILRDKVAFNNSPITISSNDLRTLKPVKKVYFTYKNGQVSINKKIYPLNKLVSTAFGQLRFSKNPYFTAGSENKIFYFSVLSERKAVDDIANSLKTEISNKLSSIINISLLDPSQERGEVILKQVIRAYNKSIDDEKNQLAANTEKFINDRLRTVENDLLSIERQQQSYKSNRGAIDIDTQGKLYLENVSTNDQKVGEINMQLSILRQIESYVKSKNLSNGIVPSTAGVNDPGLTQMVKGIYDLQLQVESLKKTTGENNPLIVSYNDQIDKIRPQILENLQNQRQSLVASKGNLTSTTQTYSSQLQSMPEMERKLVDINRELNLKSNIYTLLLQKKEETALSFISNGSPGKVIDQPQSSEFPVSPKSKMVLLGALLIVAVIAFAIISLRESSRRNIMYQTDIESLTQLKVISEITSGNSDDAIVINHDQRTLIAEQFRKLRITLNFLGIGGDKKRILITSAISGEGKSFVAINLAMSLAMTDKKVVLLDFDLNKPSLHAKFNIKKGKGIAEFLHGKVSKDGIVTQTKVNKNLSFISAGITPRNPSELIVNGRTVELLDYLDTHFDYVVIDIAPVGPVSDAHVISPLCDATLFIVRHAYTPKTLVERIDKDSLLNRLKNAAIVFNDVSPKNFSHYGYGYGYNDGYGYRPEKKQISEQR